MARPLTGKIRRDTPRRGIILSGGIPGRKTPTFPSYETL